MSFEVSMTFNGGVIVVVMSVTLSPCMMIPVGGNDPSYKRESRRPAIGAPPLPPSPFKDVIIFYIYFIITEDCKKSRTRRTKAATHSIHTHHL